MTYLKNFSRGQRGQCLDTLLLCTASAWDLVTWQNHWNIDKIVTKSWQCFNKTQFSHILETSWNIVRCEEISVDKQKHVETCWNVLKHVETVSCCHSCTMKVPLVAGGFRFQVFSGQSSAWVQHPCQTQSAGSPSLWAAGTSTHLCRCPSLKRDSN